MTNTPTSPDDLVAGAGAAGGVPQIIAHRGNRSVTPENTLAAFASAIRAGCGSIELDIVRSRDGVPMIIHDETLDATTNGAGKVSDYLAEEIAALDAGSWFDPAFAGAQVPTFTQFAHLLAQHPSVEVLLEFKGDWDEQATAGVVEIVNEHGIADRTILQSFSRVSITAQHAIAPQSRRGVLCVEEFDGLLDQCAAAGVYTVNPYVEYVLAHPEIVQRIHEAGMSTMVWTANSPTQWERLVELGVDGIITDRPDALAGWYAGRGLV